jgi:hypothetical protein
MISNQNEIVTHSSARLNFNTFDFENKKAACHSLNLIPILNGLIDRVMVTEIYIFCTLLKDKRNETEERRGPLHTKGEEKRKKSKGVNLNKDFTLPYTHVYISLHSQNIIQNVYIF